MRAAHWGEVDEASKRLEEALKRGAHDAEMMHALGVVRVHLRDLDGAERAYRDDVSDYTQAYVKSSGGGDLGNFRADLARLAEEHGITNWEENPSTYTAIGEGLAKAGVSSPALMAYKQNLSGGDASKAQLIQQGYDSGR